MENTKDEHVENLLIDMGEQLDINDILFMLSVAMERDGLGYIDINISNSEGREYHGGMYLVTEVNRG